MCVRLSVWCVPVLSRLSSLNRTGERNRFASDSDDVDDVDDDEKRRYW